MAGQWEGGSLSTFYLNRVMTRGNRRAGLGGHFSADINVTGQNTRGVSLNLMIVRGLYHDAQMTVPGGVTRVYARNGMRDVNAAVGGSVRSIISGPVEDTTFYAGFTPTVGGAWGDGVFAGATQISSLRADRLTNSTFAAGTVRSALFTTVGTDNGANGSFGVLMQNTSARVTARFPQRWSWDRFAANAGQLDQNLGDFHVRAI